MATYRAYRVDERRLIRGAEWVEAASDAEARALAQDLCGPETPTVELWQASRLVDEIDCAETAD